MYRTSPTITNCLAENVSSTVVQCWASFSPSYSLYSKTPSQPPLLIITECAHNAYAHHRDHAHSHCAWLLTKLNYIRNYLSWVFYRPPMQRVLWELSVTWSTCKGYSGSWVWPEVQILQEKQGICLLKKLLSVLQKFNYPAKSCQFYHWVVEFPDVFWKFHRKIYILVH